MSDNELKPCPFCGGRDIAIMSGGVSSVSCMSCEYTLITQPFSDDASIKMWNTRPTEEKLYERIVQLEHAVRFYRSMVDMEECDE